MHGCIRLILLTRVLFKETESNQMMIVLVCDSRFCKQGYIYEMTAVMLPFLQPREGF